MTTIQTLIDRGYAKSSAARPELQVAPVELVDRVGQCLREIGLALSRQHPQVMGTVVSVPFNGAGWSRPGDCVRALRLRANAGTIAAPAMAIGQKITVVPFDDPTVAAGDPCVIEYGQQYLPSGQAIDPSGGTVDILYARAFVMPATVNDVLDALYPALFEDVLQQDLALYLAIKDKRSEDEQTFSGLKNGGMGQMMDWAKQQTYEIVQRFPLVTPPLTNTNEGRAQPTKGEP